MLGNKETNDKINIDLRGEVPQRNYKELKGTMLSKKNISSTS